VQALSMKHPDKESTNTIEKSGGSSREVCVDERVNGCARRVNEATA